MSAKMNYSVLILRMPYFLALISVDTLVFWWGATLKVWKKEWSVWSSGGFVNPSSLLTITFLLFLEPFMAQCLSNVLYQTSWIKCTLSHLSHSLLSPNSIFYLLLNTIGWTHNLTLHTIRWYARFNEKPNPPAWGPFHYNGPNSTFCGHGLFYEQE